jgi:hypothetical protein
MEALSVQYPNADPWISQIGKFDSPSTNMMIDFPDILSHDQFGN